MKKCFKRIFWILFSLGLFLFFLLLIHPAWIGSFSASVARLVVPKMTKSEFGMEDLGINLYSGKIYSEGISIKSPDDNKSDAVSLKSFAVNFDTPSMITNERHIKEVFVDGLQVYGDVTFSNLRQLRDNIEEFLGVDKDKKKKDDEKKKDAEKSDSKLVIDRIVISGTEFKWGHAKVVLPNIELKDVGKDEPTDSDGVLSVILDAICDASDKVVFGSGKALKLSIEGGDKLVEGAKAITEAVGGAASVVGDAAGDVGKSIKDVKESLKGIKNIFKK